MAVREYRGGKVTHWREAVATQAQNYNDFATPLSVNEILAIAKSVAKWVWARDADAELRFITRQKLKELRAVKPRG